MKTVKRLVCIALSAALVISLSPLAFPDAYAADRSQYITSLTVSPSTVEANGKVRVDVTFSDGSPGTHVFQGGDTIVVTWPSGGEAYLHGYASEIPLVSSGGVTYANVSVTAAGAVVTFNDAVNDLYDVNGSFYFELLAKNVTDTTEQDTKVVTVTGGSRTADVTIIKPASGSGSGTGGEPPDFRKQADEIGGGWTHIDGIEGWVMTLDPDDPTYTQWMLTANEGQKTIISDITITDTLGQGQAIDTSWAHLYSRGRYSKNYQGTVAEVKAAFEADFPGSSLAFDSAGNLSWVITRSASDGTAWYLRYRCRITDFSLLTLQNSADIYWTGGDGRTYSGHDESQFANVQQGGDVGVTPRGSVKITKLVEGTDVPVKGVKFKLDVLEGDSWHNVATLTTGRDGKASKDALLLGHYRLYEVSAPAYVVPAHTIDDPYEFDLDPNDPVLQNYELTIENEIVRADVTARKKWLAADGSVDESEHPTIYFMLMRSVGGGQAEPVGDILPLDDGVLSVTWEDLLKFDAYGHRYVYTVREVDEEGNDLTVDGYDKTESGLTVTNRMPKPPGGPATGDTGGGIVSWLLVLFASAALLAGLLAKTSRGRP